MYISKFILELLGVGPLHLDNLVIARSVVKRVATLREVFHHIVLVEDGNPRTVVPRELKFVVA